MDEPSRDIASYLLKFVEFRTGRSLCQVNRFWNEQCDAKPLWKRWFQEVFGYLDSALPDPCSNWKWYFANFWSSRKMARQAIKLPERFEPFFYYRVENKPCVFVENYHDAISLQTGDIILDAKLIAKWNAEYPNWGITFYDAQLRTLIQGFSVDVRVSTPQQLWFPKIPFDYYCDLLFPYVVHIKMEKLDRDNLVFHLRESGYIDWYSDPRLPGKKIYVRTMVGRMTIGEFGRNILHDILHEECYEANEDSYHLILLDARY